MHPHCHPITHGSLVAADGRLRPNPRRLGTHGSYTQQAVGTPDVGAGPSLPAGASREVQPEPFLICASQCPPLRCEPRQTHTFWAKGTGDVGGAHGLLRNEKRTVVCTGVVTGFEGTSNSDTSQKPAGWLLQHSTRHFESAAQPCAEAPAGGKDA